MILFTRTIPLKNPFKGDELMNRNIKKLLELMDANQAVNRLVGNHVIQSLLGSNDATKNQVPRFESIRSELSCNQFSASRLKALLLMACSNSFPKYEQALAIFTETMNQSEIEVMELIDILKSA